MIFINNVIFLLQSAEVYTMVKKDLDEIGTAVKSEASHVFSTTSNAIGKTFKVPTHEPLIFDIYD